jgi:hypothetical protein
VINTMRELKPKRFRFLAVQWYWLLIHMIDTPTLELVTAGVDAHRMKASTK